MIKQYELCIYPPPPKKNKKFQLLKKRTSMKFWN